MITVYDQQICFKCKGKKPIGDFIEKGNRYINCSDCRSERKVRKKNTLQLRLKKKRHKTE